MQLMFNFDNDDIEDEPLTYFKSLTDVPSEIKEYISKISDSRIMYDKNTKKYYCSKCLHELKNKYCSNCNKEYKVPFNSLKYILEVDIDNIKKYTNDTSFYVFYTINEQVLLYEFSVYIYYDGFYMTVPYQLRKIRIKHAYQVLKTGLNQLDSNKVYNFKDLDKILTNAGEFDIDMYEKFLIDNYCDSFLYVDNLDKLKYNELYKNSYIWKLKNTFTKDYFSLASLTIYPVYYKQFEYLVKMKLYSLAITDPYKIKDSNNFVEAFGVDKKYYDFMKDINISSAYLDAMRIFPTKDLELLNFVSKDPWLISKLSNYVPIDKLKNYFLKQNLTGENIYDYYDYIKNLIELEVDLNDKNILFPKDFFNEHDKTYLEITILNDREINKKIRDLSNILELNIYIDNKYVIFPSSSLESLIEDNNQIKTYTSRINNSNTDIYFMRYKDSNKKTLITIEVKKDWVVSATSRDNKGLTKEMERIIDKWEKNILPIINSKK